MFGRTKEKLGTHHSTQHHQHHKDTNAHYRVGNLNQKFKYSHIWAPTAPNIFILCVWGGTGASLWLRCSEGQKQNLAPTTLLNMISIIKTQNADYRVENLNRLLADTGTCTYTYLVYKKIIHLSEL